MPDYQKGKIYKICDIGFNKTYIGGTTQELSMRMTGHRREYDRYLAGTFDKLSVFDMFDEFGIKYCKIYLIENYPCNSKSELEAREGLHIQNTECVNKIKIGRTPKQYRDDNKERILERERLYRDKNKDHIKDYHKNYYEENEQEILTKTREY